MRARNGRAALVRAEVAPARIGTGAAVRGRENSGVLRPVLLAQGLPMRGPGVAVDCGFQRHGRDDHRGPDRGTSRTGEGRCKI